MHALSAIRSTPILPSEPVVAAAPEPLLSVILPTYNERENVSVLVPRLLDILRDVPCEVIVVDDGSPDGTADTVREMGASDARVRLVERSGKAGLASAVFAGAAEARGRLAAVMDADLSHDPELLPEMLARAEDGCDVVIGSRYVRGGSFANQPLVRRLISRVLNTGVRIMLLLPQHDVLTGYALCRRELLTQMPTRYSSRGFKWLLELLTVYGGLQVDESPIVFQNRYAGVSKADAREALALAVLCLRLAPRRLRRTPATSASAT